MLMGSTITSFGPMKSPKGVNTSICVKSKYTRLPKTMEHNSVHCLINLMMRIDSAITDIFYAKVYKKVEDSIQNHLKSSSHSLYSLLF